MTVKRLQTIALDKNDTFDIVDKIILSGYLLYFVIVLECKEAI